MFFPVQYMVPKGSLYITHNIISTTHQQLTNIYWALPYARQAL